MWAVLTRLEEPKNASLTLLQKLKLYNGKTPARLYRRQRQGAASARPSSEGMHGISPALHPGQDLQRPGGASEATTASTRSWCCNELEVGLQHHSLITSEEQRKRYRELLSVVQARNTKTSSRTRCSAPSPPTKTPSTRLCGNYIDNVKAYTQREKVRNKYTGQDEEPDERLMRSIEEKIDIPESRKDDFRREIMNYIGALAIDGKKFDYKYQRAAAQGAGTEAVRGPEGFDQADQPGFQRGR